MNYINLDQAVKLHMRDWSSKRYLRARRLDSALRILIMILFWAVIGWLVFA